MIRTLKVILENISNLCNIKKFLFLSIRKIGNNKMLLITILRSVSKLFNNWKFLFFKYVDPAFRFMYFPFDGELDFYLKMIFIV